MGRARPTVLLRSTEPQRSPTNDLRKRSCSEDLVVLGPVLIYFIFGGIVIGRENLDRWPHPRSRSICEDCISLRWGGALHSPSSFHGVARAGTNHRGSRTASSKPSLPSARNSITRFIAFARASGFLTVSPAASPSRELGAGGCCAGCGRWFTGQCFGLSRSDKSSVMS